MKVFLSLCLFSYISTVTSVKYFDVRDYGGKNDGITMNTNAFRTAVQMAASANPDPGSSYNIVLVTGGGSYLTGQIVLQSNVYLMVDVNTNITGSTNVTEYPTDESMWAIIFALGANNIGIIGDGIIDGQQDKYIGGWNDPNNEFIPMGWLPGQCVGECRPRLVRLRTCTNIFIENITLMNSPDWTFHLENSSNIFINNYNQYGSHLWPNNDGIDIDSSQNVILLNSSINTADDGVCIKSTVGLNVLNNITVRNTIIRSRSAAIKFGSNTDTNCSNLLFENITIWDSNRGLGIQQRSQGNITNVTFRDITIETRYQPENWWGSGEPLYISSMPRAAGGIVGQISNITFENIIARSENAAFLSGRAPGLTLENIVLKNVSITIDKWSNYSTPGLSYIPTTAISPQKILPPNMTVVGIVVEYSAGVMLNDVNINFMDANRQSYWGNVCINTTNAMHPVTVNGGTCSL